MTTLTGIVASVVMHSSAAAFSHFGVTIEPMPMDKPAPARVIARSHAGQPAAPLAQKIADCPVRPARGHADKV